MLIDQEHQGFYIHVRTSYNSPTKKSYAGYTVFPGITLPPRKLIPHSQGGSIEAKPSLTSRSSMVSKRLELRFCV
jgi:hypothetical protein